VHVFQVLSQGLLHDVVLPELLFLLIAKQERGLDKFNHILELLIETHHCFHGVELAIVGVLGEGTGRLQVVGFVVELPGEELLVLEEVAYLSVEVYCLAVVVDVLVFLALQLDVQVGPSHQFLIADGLVDLLAEIVFDVE
jgi:hypothetical protein